MSSPRVCVTGLGVVSPLGNTVEETWASILSGRSGADHITAFDASQWPTQIGCEVKAFQLNDKAILPVQRRFLNRALSFGMEATFEAVKSSGITGVLSPDELGVCVGASISAVSPIDLPTLLGPPRSSATSETRGRYLSSIKSHPGIFAGLISERWNAFGETATHHTACASSGQSVGHAFRMIREGRAKAVIAGGADSLFEELSLSGFCLIGALSTNNESPELASRPFDKDRDGFVAGEGAAMLVLEDYELAKMRGAHIIAEIIGYGETLSAFRITDLPPNGRGVVEAMHDAIAMAGINYDDIGYINAHGTSTELNDRIESLAIRRVFGSRGVTPMVSSTKGQTGHLIAAAGALEAVLSILALRDQVAPANINLFETDCGEDINFAPRSVCDLRMVSAMSNSIGFGGTNTSILLSGGI